MTTSQSDFIHAIAPLVQKYAPQYQIMVCSPIIAQAILESGWGKSKLSAKYHNYFGLKCGSKWTGKSVNLTTAEEYTAGTYTTIKDNFRVYDSMESGVKGYFEFIQLERYHNLRGITSPEKYLRTIKADGYATSSTYVSDLLKVVDAYDLTDYDKQEAVMSISEKDVKICGHGSNTPSVKNLYTYTAQRYAKTAPNGKHKGVACVRRLKAMTDEGRVNFVEAYNIILGRNVYNQTRRGYVYTKYSNGKYYSDCSSSGMAAMKRIGYNIGSWLLNTAGIYESNLFEDVPVKIEKGHITNPEVLKVADCILYIGNDPKRPKQIGHVEYVYSMPKASKTPIQPVEKAYTGKYPTLPARGYFRLKDGYNNGSDVVANVKLLQKLLAWITGDKVSADGKYGSQTEAAVKKAQKILGVTVDGQFGKKTLAAAKAYKK